MKTKYFFMEFADDKLLILFFTIASCLLLAFLVNFVLGIQTIYTQLFYIPILLAGIWYFSTLPSFQKEFVFVAIFIGALHLITTYTTLGYFVTGAFERYAIFIVVAYVIGHVSNKYAKGKKELQKSEERYRVLFESAKDGIFVEDLAGNIVDANQEACEMLGYAYDELIHLNVREIVPPEIAARESDFIQRIQETGLGVAEVENVRKEGTRIVIAMSATIVEISDKPHIIVIARDITKHKQMDEEREHLLKELEAKNTELERFTYTVSHDLRSPLFAIEGFARLLGKNLKEGKAEKVEKDLKQIEEGVTMMDRLLTDTLELSRIGRVANPSEDVPFGEIVQEALEQTTEQIKSSGVEISVAEDFPTVHVDRMRIVEVLVNLITNSINYMGEHPHPKIGIGHRLDPDSNETVFFVRDNGIGLDPSQHEKVFTLFYQVDKSSMGTGAGLAIVKRIIEVHGGRIWIESEKGKGCTVCFTLPNIFIKR